MSAWTEFASPSLATRKRITTAKQEEKDSWQSSIISGITLENQRHLCGQKKLLFVDPVCGHYLPDRRREVKKTMP